MGCHALLQGIFLTQGLNSGVLNCRQILYHLSHQGSLTEKTELLLLGIECFLFCFVSTERVEEVSVHNKLMVRVSDSPQWFLLIDLKKKLLFISMQ